MIDANRRSLMRGLARIAAWQIVTAVLIGGVAYVLTPKLNREDDLVPLWAGLTIVLGAMLIGFMPLRRLLRAGPENIVSAWVAAMVLRMFASLAGLVVVASMMQSDTAVLTALFVCFTYVVLLAVETAGMIRLMRRAFEDRGTDSQGDR